ncbi:MAG: RNA polymerase sigma factor [Parabacteroides sp.]
MELYSDTYYISRIQAGDTRCFACLLDRYSRPVHALIYQIVHNREDAEELAQDVFVKTYEHLSRFKGDCSFSTWLYRIAYNAAISATRKAKHEWLAINETLMEQVSEADAEAFLEQPGDVGQVERLERVLACLPPEERTLVLLFYWQSKSIEEISSISGLSVANVKTRLHRIRKKIYVGIKTLEEQEDE